MPDDRRTPIERAIDARLRGINSGNYRKNTKHVLGEFRAFCERKHGITNPENLKVIHCRRYAQDLRDRANSDDADTISAATANTYFDIVRAFLSWCVDDERIDANPARPNRATDPLPKPRNDPDRQFWPSDVRERFLSHMDAHVDDVLDRTDAGDHERLQAYRDRALVYIVALSGARGAELFRDTNDDHREGLRWKDIDLDRGIFEVFGKTRENQEVTLPTPACKRLRRYRDQLDPGSDEWPLWPTFHPPSVSRAVRKALKVADYTASEREGLFEDADPWAVARETGVTPPNISIQAARDVVEDHSQAAGLTGNDGDPLKLHGARRGLGSELYGADAELAQETLRHESIETTHESYRDQQAEQRREDVEDVLYGDE